VCAGGTVARCEPVCEEGGGGSGGRRISHGIIKPSALPLVAACAALALIAVLGFAAPTSKQTELLGMAEKWEADEDSMTLGVADELARSSLRQSKESLGRDSIYSKGQLAASPSYSVGLGNKMSNLEEKSQRLRLKEEQIRNMAHIDRTKAHFLRVQASDDISTAKHSLTQVYNLDKTLKGIKADARKKKQEFHQGTLAVKAKHEKLEELKKDAASVDKKVKTLRKKVASLMNVVSKDKEMDAKTKDKEDAEREILSSVLVKRDRRAKRVDTVEGSLARMQKKFEAARKAVKAVTGSKAH